MAGEKIRTFITQVGLVEAKRVLINPSHPHYQDDHRFQQVLDNLKLLGVMKSLESGYISYENGTQLIRDPVSPLYEDVDPHKEFLEHGAP